MICVPPLSFDDLSGKIEIIRCNGVDYQVYGDYFSSISPLYSEIRMTGKNSLYIKCKNEAFQEFLNACQKKSFIVTSENVEDLILISTIFKIQKLVDFLTCTRNNINQQKSVIDAMQAELSKLSKKLDKQHHELENLKRKQMTIPDRSNSTGAIQAEFNSPISPSNSKVIEFTGKPMKGVFFWLRQQTTESLASAGLVKCSASSTNHISNCVDDLVENIRFCKWISAPKKRSWVKIDFIDKVLTMRAYTIRIPSALGIGWTPKSWIVEGSTDEITWQIIDEHRNNSVFENDVNICTWTVTDAGPFRYIKITQTESSNPTEAYFTLCALEFFGTIQNRPAFL